METAETTKRGKREIRAVLPSVTVTISMKPWLTHADVDERPVATFATTEDEGLIERARALLELDQGEEAVATLAERGLAKLTEFAPDNDYRVVATFELPEPARRPGRPRVYDEPRRDVFIRLPATLLADVDAAAEGGNRTAWIEAAVREKLARERDA